MINNVKQEAKNVLHRTLIFGLLLFVLFAKTTHADTKGNELPAHCRDLSKYGLPSTNVRLLCKSKFLVGYSDETKTPIWTIERLGSARIPVSTGRETQAFEEDAEIPSHHRATLQDYVGNGFDRGHLVAAGNYIDDPKAYRETFMLSNVAPQIGPGFNRGIWRTLEEEIRNLAQCTDELFVYTALVFPDSVVPRPTIGKSQINIPSGFIKVLFLPEQRKAISFYAENRRHTSTNIGTLLSSVDRVEIISRFQFLATLPPLVEKDIESFAPKIPWSIVKETGRCSIRTNH